MPKNPRSGFGFCRHDCFAGGLHSLGLDLSSISFVAVPVVAGWGVLCLWSGKRQIALAAARETAGDDTIPPATGVRP
jgi:hypothetical protein